ncbi:MAG: hypothetical protein ABIV63_13485 [Caldimonas sp.]
MLVSLSIIAVAGAFMAGTAGAAEATPPTDRTKPVTAARIGGGPADEAFRAAQDASGKRFVEAKAACREKPRAERGGCMTTARAELRKQHAEAKSAHDAARKKL